MIYRHISSKTIIGRVSRLLDSSEWEAVARIYLYDAIQKIGLNYSTSYKVTGGDDLDDTDECLTDVENHLVDLPIDLELLVKIEYNGYRLPYSPDRSIFGLNSCDDYIWGRVSDECVHYYAINEGKIKTSFDEGKIKIFYKKFNCDQDGFIMIPDVAEYKEALIWFLFSDLLLEGYKPKLQSMTYQEAELRATDKKFKARGRLKQLTNDERDALSNQLTSINLDNTITKIYT